MLLPRFLQECSSLYLQHMTVGVVVLLFAMAAGGETKIKVPDGAVVPAVIAFGDSIMDQGMNNYIVTMAKGNFPPYGQDFMGGPTGRFSNGKTPPDLLVEELGIKELMPPYLDPNLKPEDLKTGVSFASGACGYDPYTSLIASAIPMTEQLNYFQEYLGKLKSAYGEKETKMIAENSLYFVVAGSDDLANTWFTAGLPKFKFDLNSYTDLIVHNASIFIQELYKTGARRIGVFSLAPIGCMPSQRTLRGGIGRSCVDEANAAAQLTNSKFAAEIHSLSKKLPNSKLVFVDIYEPLMYLIKNPHQFGFEVADQGCCGTGMIEASILCNRLCKTCGDRSKYLFWDSYHPTEKGYRVLLKMVLKKYFYRLF